MTRPTQEPERDRVLSEEDFLNAIAYAGIETTDFNRVVAHDAALRTLIGELVGANDGLLEAFDAWRGAAQVFVGDFREHEERIRAAVARAKDVLP